MSDSESSGYESTASDADVYSSDDEPVTKVGAKIAAKIAAKLGGTSSKKSKTQKSTVDVDELVDEDLDVEDMVNDAEGDVDDVDLATPKDLAGGIDSTDGYDSTPEKELYMPKDLDDEATINAARNRDSSNKRGKKLKAESRKVKNSDDEASEDADNEYDPDEAAEVEQISKIRDNDDPQDDRCAALIKSQIELQVPRKPNQQRKKIIVVNKGPNALQLTSDRMQKYEIVEVGSIRGEQIAKYNNPIGLDNPPDDPIEAAYTELYARKTPLIIRRTLSTVIEPDGTIIEYVEDLDPKSPDIEIPAIV
jgi:DNA-directed RNA polymerase subunit K/omega